MGSSSCTLGFILLDKAIRILVRRMHAMLYFIVKSGELQHPETA
jgi:hypothetical protein